MSDILLHEIPGHMIASSYAPPSGVPRWIRRVRPLRLLRCCSFFQSSGNQRVAPSSGVETVAPLSSRGARPPPHITRSITALPASLLISFRVRSALACLDPRSRRGDRPERPQPMCDRGPSHLRDCVLRLFPRLTGLRQQCRVDAESSHQLTIDGPTFFRHTVTPCIRVRGDRLLEPVCILA